MLQVAIADVPGTGRCHLIADDADVRAAAEDEGLFAPAFEVVVVGDFVVLEEQVLRGNGEQERYIESMEYIVFDTYVPMVVFFLVLELPYLGIDSDDSFRKLVAGCEIIGECVVADEDVFAGSAFVPTLGISGQKDGGAG